MKKRVIALICALLLLLSALPLSSCASRGEDGKIKILCTLFPQYDWLKNIIGDSDTVELSLIIANGSDPHSYQPTAADILKISNCDMIVFTGGDSDAWVEEALQRASRPEIIQIKLCELSGMTLHDVSSSSHSHEHGHDHSHGHGVFDEHIWLSLRNAMTATKRLAEALCELDPDNADKYEKNASAYTSKLGELDLAYTSAADSVDESERFVLFADRFPFVYLLSDYGIEYQAAFDGCTTDVDADFDTVLTLIKEAELHGADCVAVTEGSDGALARTVISSAKHATMELLVMNSLQSISSADIENGASYLSLMEQNLAVLKKAIGAK